MFIVIHHFPISLSEKCGKDDSLKYITISVIQVKSISIKINCRYSEIQWRIFLIYAYPKVTHKETKISLNSKFSL